jgi:hypothetical protein
LGPDETGGSLFGRREGLEDAGGPSGEGADTDAVSVGGVFFSPEEEVGVERLVRKTPIEVDTASSKTLASSFDAPPHVPHLTHHGPIFHPRRDTPRDRIAVPSKRRPFSVLALTSTESKEEPFDGDFGSESNTKSPFDRVNPSAIDRTLSVSAASATSTRKRGTRERERRRNIVCCCGKRRVFEKSS